MFVHQAAVCDIINELGLSCGDLSLNEIQPNPIEALLCKQTKNCIGIHSQDSSLEGKVNFSFVVFGACFLFTEKKGSIKSIV